MQNLSCSNITQKVTGMEAFHYQRIFNLRCGHRSLRRFAWRKTSAVIQRNPDNLSEPDEEMGGPMGKSSLRQTISG